MIMIMNRVYIKSYECSVDALAVRLAAMNGVRLPALLWIRNLKSGVGELVLVALVQSLLHHLSSMRLVLLYPRITNHSYIVVHIKMEEGSALASRLVDDEVVEGGRVREDQVVVVEQALRIRVRNASALG